MHRLRTAIRILFSKTYYAYTANKHDIYYQDANHLKLIHANEIIYNLSQAINAQAVDDHQQALLDEYKKYLN